MRIGHLLRSWLAAVSTLGSILAALVSSPVALAAAIPPGDLFFAPTSLVEGNYPRKSYFGDGELSPWTFAWTMADIVAVDPGRVDITFTGLNILPILKANPALGADEGAYTVADLSAITVANYPTYYAFVAGTSVFVPGTHYAAELTNNVIVAYIVAPGPWTFRVNTISRPFPGGPLEPKSYIYAVLIEDFYSILPDHELIPTHVHRQVAPELFFGGGAAGAPPGTVHIVSDGDPDDNGFLKNACQLLMDQGKAPKKATGVAALVQKICDAQAANGGNPVAVNIYAHGNGPSSGDGGSGIMKVGTEFICCGDGCTKKPGKFGECVKGKVTGITLWSCYVASDGTFTQDMANGSGVTVGGWDIAVTCAAKKTFFGFTTSDGYFDWDAKGKKKDKEKQGCLENPCVGDIDFNGAIDGADLASLLGNWGTDGGEGSCGDLDLDGVVLGGDLAILLGGWGECPFLGPAVCGTGGSCCSASGSPGCGDPFCCEFVCANDPFCCQTRWDGICAAAAASLPNCGCPTTPTCGGSSNDCCATGDGPGCSDADCCDSVCEFDEYCCSTEWDNVCVEEAAGMCGSMCTPTCPGGSTSEGEPCGGNLNGGCNVGPPAFTPISIGQTICGSFWANGGLRDTDWYLLNVPVPTFVRLNVTAAVPSAVFILTNNCANLQILAQGDGGNPTNSAGACLQPGQYILFIATTNFNGLPCGNSNGYVASVIQDQQETCASPFCGQGGSCFIPHPQPGCNDAGCCQEVCQVDPSCCQSGWDAQCVNIASQLCQPGR